MVKEVGLVSGKRNRSRLSSKKKTEGKVPKKIHKAEREKLKRDYLNELFLELANSLEANRQCNGKASILSDATRLLQELLLQIECLKRENSTLLSESRYVGMERNELKEENVVLQAEIEMLQTKIQERNCSDPTCNATIAEPQQNMSISTLPSADANISLPVIDSGLQPPVMGPILVIPLHDLPSYSGAGQPLPTTSLNVSRPHARYPTPSDSWPSQLLDRQLQKSSQDQEISICTITTDSSEKLQCPSQTIHELHKGLREESALMPQALNMVN